MLLLWVSVVSSPTTTEYTSGDHLDLSGLVVNLKMSNGDTETVAFDDFVLKGLTVSPANGTKLEATDVKVIKVTITHTETGITAVQDIKVNPYVAPSYFLKFVPVQYSPMANISLHQDSVSNPPVSQNFLVKCLDSSNGETMSMGDGTGNSYSTLDMFYSQAQYINHSISFDGETWFSVTITR